MTESVELPSRLARGLDGGQKQRDQDSDDGDDHQQLDEREPARLLAADKVHPCRILSNRMCCMQHKAPLEKKSPRQFR
jgi:hypothetical protein